MTRRLTEEVCNQLYAKYGTPDHVIGHCLAVSEVGKRMAQAINQHGGHLDEALIWSAGRIHDVMRTEDNHGEVAAEMLVKEGYPDEAQIVRHHMHYQFHAIDQLDETDIMCLADRLVKEDRYVGLDERIDYLIHKPGENQERTRRILEAKALTRGLMDQIEAIIGQTIDSLFLE